MLYGIWFLLRLCVCAFGKFLITVGLICSAYILAGHKYLGSYLPLFADESAKRNKAVIWVDMIVAVSCGACTGWSDLENSCSERERESPAMRPQTMEHNIHCYHYIMIFILRLELEEDKCIIIHSIIHSVCLFKSFFTAAGLIFVSREVIRNILTSPYIFNQSTLRSASEAAIKWYNSYNHNGSAIV